MVISLKLVKQAKETLKSIKEKQDKFKEDCNKKEREIKDIFWNKKRELQEEENKQISNLEQKEEEKNNDFESEKTEHKEVIKEFKESLEFYKISLKMDRETLKSPQVYYYGYVKDEKGNSDYSKEKQRFYINPINVLIDDEFKKILVYITKNNKPKNCFSLIVCGNTRLTSNLLEIPYSFGIHTQIDNSNIRTRIKDFESEEEAKSYFNRNKTKILKSFLEEHSKIELKYCEFIKEIKADEELKKKWRVAYLEDKKYYYENNYSQGTETEEYKQIVKELKEENEL
jgi:hypothetical protein